jgi:hypothetical protein
MRIPSLLVVLALGCGVDEPDCDVVTAHIAELRIAPRIAASPPADRAQHRANLVDVIAPELRGRCDRANDVERTCLLAAVTLAELEACTRRAP